MGASLPRGVHKVPFGHGPVEWLGSRSYQAVDLHPPAVPHLLQEEDDSCSAAPRGPGAGD